MLKVSKSPRYNFIQLFRFIAALMVIILHSTFYAQERLDKGIARYNSGYNGVLLFFVISGFVMVISSQRLLNEEHGGRTFMLKRLIRIVPIYWLLNTYKLIVLLVSSNIVKHAAVAPLFIIKSYFFIPAINIDGKYEPFYGVGWTLNYEMFFYLWFAIALFFKVKPLYLLGPVFVALACLSLISTPGWGAFGYYTNGIVLYFLYGMIIGYLILNSRKLPSNLALGIIVVGLIVLFAPQQIMPAWLNNHPFPYLHILAALIIYAGASVHNDFDSKIPKWLVYLGSASYSLYLIHPIIAPLSPTLLSKVSLHIGWLSVIISVIMALGVGCLFYQYCETPLTNGFNKFAKKHKWFA